MQKLYCHYYAAQYLMIYFKNAPERVFPLRCLKFLQNCHCCVKFWKIVNEILNAMVMTFGIVYRVIILAFILRLIAVYLKNMQKRK